VFILNPPKRDRYLVDTTGFAAQICLHKHTVRRVYYIKVSAVPLTAEPARLLRPPKRDRYLVDITGFAARLCLHRHHRLEVMSPIFVHIYPYAKS
jgi:hypothetical protein